MINHFAENSIHYTVTSSLLSRFRDEIIEGYFQPGQHLRLEELAARYRQEHWAIWRACQAGKVDQTAQLVRHHVAHSCEALIAHIQRQTAEQPTDDSTASDEHASA